MNIIEAVEMIKTGAAPLGVARARVKTDKNGMPEWGIFVWEKEKWDQGYKDCHVQLVIKDILATDWIAIER